MTESEKALIEERFSGVYARMDSNGEISDLQHTQINDTLLRIEQQTIKTNGRVTALESWRWKIIGISIGVASVIGVIIKLL